MSVVVCPELIRVYARNFYFEIGRQPLTGKVGLNTEVAWTYYDCTTGTVLFLWKLVSPKSF